MSTTIDERVVEMKFDNKNFESNVSTTMSTLDKLKEKLNFKGAERALDELGDAGRKFNLDGMAESIDGVTLKFSALGVAGIEVMRRITNAAIDAAQAIQRELGTGIQGAIAGFNKYGEKNTAVATLIGQGFDMDTVTDQLNKLNWFTDETSYNFTDMVTNIGKFTASGQELDDSVEAMMGIANWAAMSGQNATTASRAMYQLAQAMGKGVLRYDDYRSIQNANMDTLQFRQQAVQAAIAVGTLREAADGTYTVMKDGAEDVSLSMAELFSGGKDGGLTGSLWFNSDVMMRVFGQYSSAVDRLYSYATAREITASEAMQEIGNTLDEFGLKAFRAAQEARNWSDVADSVADAVSTSWMKTFELIFGNYEESVEVFTQMANDLYDIFAEPINELNERLFEGLSSGWRRLASASGVSSAQMKNAFLESAREQGVAIDDLIADYGSFEKALKSGWVTEEILQGTLEDLEKSLRGLSVTQLEEAGYTEEQRDKLIELNEAFRTGEVDISEWVEALSGVSGRENLMQAIWNIRDALFAVDEETGRGIGIIAVFKEAWAELFPPADGDKIYSMTERIRDLTESLIPSAETADKLRRAFKGVAAVFSILWQTAKGVIDVVRSIFSAFGSGEQPILSFAASIGDILSQFAQSGKIGEFFGRVIEKVTSTLSKVTPVVDRVVSAVTSSLSWAWDFLKGLWNALPQDVRDSITSVGEYLSSGLRQLGVLFEPVKKAASEAFRSFADEAGLSIPDVQTALSHLAPIAGKAFGHVRTFAVRAWPVVKKVVGHISRNLADLFSALGRLAAALWPVIKKAVASFGPVISDLWSRIKDGAVKAWPTIQKIFKGISDTAVKVWTVSNKAFEKVTGMSIPEAFLNIGTAIGNAIDKLAEFIDSLSEKEINIPKGISDLWHAIWDFMAGLPEDFQEGTGAIGKAFTWLGEKLGSLSDSESPVSKGLSALRSMLDGLLKWLGDTDLEGLMKALKEGDWDTLKRVFDSIIHVFMSLQGLKALRGAASLLDGAGSVTEAIGDFAYTARRNIQIRNVLGIALSIIMACIAIGQILKAVKEVADLIKDGEYTEEQLQHAILIVAEIGGLLLAIVDLPALGKNSISLGQALSYLAVMWSIKQLIGVAEEIANNRHQAALRRAVGTIEELTIVLGVVVGATAFGPSQVSWGQAASYLTVMWSIKGLVEAAKEIADASDPASLDHAFTNIEELMAILGLVVGGPGIAVSLANILAPAGNGITQLNFGGLAFAFLAIAATLYIISHFVLPELTAFTESDLTSIEGAMKAVSDVIWAVGLMAAILSIVAGYSSPAGMNAASIMLVAIGAVIWVVGDMITKILTVGDADSAKSILGKLIGLMTIIIGGDGLIALISALSETGNNALMAEAIVLMVAIGAVIWAIGDAVSKILAVGDADGAKSILGKIIGLMTIIVGGDGLIALISALSETGNNMILIMAAVMLALLGGIIWVIGDVVSSLVQTGDVSGATAIMDHLAILLGTMLAGDGLIMALSKLANATVGTIIMAVLILVALVDIMRAIGETVSVILATGDTEGAVLIMDHIAILLGAMMAGDGLIMGLSRLANANVGTIIMAVAILGALAGIMYVIGVTVSAIMSVGSASEAAGILDAIATTVFVLGIVAGGLVALMGTATVAAVIEAGVIIAELAGAIWVVGDAVAAILGAGNVDQAITAATSIVELLGVMALVVGALGGVITAFPMVGVGMAVAGGILLGISEAIANVAHALVDAGVGIAMISTHATPENLGKVGEAGKALANFALDMNKLHTNGSAGIKDLTKVAEPLRDIVDAVSGLDSAVGEDVLGTLISSFNAFAEAVSLNAPLITDEVTAMVNTIQDTVAGIRPKFYEYGVNSVVGYINGFNSRLSWAIQAVSNGMISITEAAAHALNSHSPSRVFAALGEYSMEGYAIGVENSARDAEDAVIDALQNTINHLAEYLDENKEFDPVVRPVLDLSDIESGASQIGGYFSASQAVGIAASMNDARGVNPYDDSAQTIGTGGATYSFVQNNYSPKPLSRLEIYRQTRNQISAIEGAMRTV